MSIKTKIAEGKGRELGRAGHGNLPGICVCPVSCLLSLSVSVCAALSLTSKAGARERREGQERQPRGGEPWLDLETTKRKKKEKKYHRDNKNKIMPSLCQNHIKLCVVRRGSWGFGLWVEVTLFFVMRRNTKPPLLLALSSNVLLPSFACLRHPHSMSHSHQTSHIPHDNLYYTGTHAPRQARKEHA